MSPSAPPQPKQHTAPFGHTAFGIRAAVVAGIVALAAMIGVIAGLANAAQADSADARSADRLAGLEKSVVLLETEWTGRILVPAYASADHVAGYTNAFSTYVGCTGWYVSTTAQIVTAGHCVDPAHGREAIIREYLQDQHLAQFTNDALADWSVDGGTTGSPVFGTVQAYQPQGLAGATITSPTTVGIVDFKPMDNGDVALLQIPDMTKETPPLAVALAAPQLGDPVTAIGFPGNLREVADQSQIARASFKTGSVSSRQVTRQGVAKIEVSAALSPGMSGGPTVNRDGQVVGVNSTAMSEAFGFITNTPDLRAFLLSHDVALAQPSAGPAEITVVWYVLGGIVMLSALGAATLMVIRRRRHTQPAAAGDAAADAIHPMRSATPMSGPEPGHRRATASPTAGPLVGSAPNHRVDRAVLNGSSPTSASNGNHRGAGDILTSVTRYCSACGAEHRHSDRFCPGCGRPTG